jgi:outer membrane protein TolC
MLLPITKKSTFIAAVAVLLSTFVTAQKPLDNYVAEALANNKTIRQQNFQLDKALYALKEAKSYFMPSVTLLGSYVKSKGGRTIDFPIGDLLNPVYSSLNTLTETENFPQLDNQSIQLNPDNFYDAKLRTSLSVINAEIMINKKIKKEMITLQQATLNVYKRQLVKDVKSAYYQYSQADKAVAIYVNALSLVNENIRVNESFLRNGVRNGTALTRAKAEKERIDAAITEAINNRTNAQSYFNFLLNRSLDETIILDSASTENPEVIIAGNGDITGREELQQVKSELSANTLNKKLQQSYLVPKLNTFLDLGSQGNDFKVNNKSQYYLWGVNLQWDLFAGGQHTYKTKQVQADVNTSQLRYDNTLNLLEMQLKQTINNYNTAVANHKSAATQLSLSMKYYNDQSKVYKEGQLLYIELLDAQNQITQAALQASVAYSNVLIAAAELERCQASYPLQ